MESEALATESSMASIPGNDENTPPAPEERPEAAGSGQKKRKTHRLKQRFTVVRKLGQGTYGKVQLAINNETGLEVSSSIIPPALPVLTLSFIPPLGRNQNNQKVQSRK